MINIIHTFFTLQTSNVLGFTIYHVSRNPEVQARLHDEVTRVLNGRIATAEDLPKMQYLKNVIRESMRFDCSIILDNIYKTSIVISIVIHYCFCD